MLKTQVIQFSLFINLKNISTLIEIKDTYQLFSLAETGLLRQYINLNIPNILVIANS